MEMLPSCCVGDVIFIPSVLPPGNPPLVPCSVCTGVTHTTASRIAAQKPSLYCRYTDHLQSLMHRNFSLFHGLIGTQLFTAIQCLS